MILIIGPTERRLCNDGYFRDFALFGTFQSCVKQYKSLPHALRRAKRLTDGGAPARAVVIPLSAGYSVEAGGTVIRTTPCPNKPGYVTHTHHRLSEFVYCADKIVAFPVHAC